MSDDRFAVQRTQITRVGRTRTALMLTDIVGYSRRMSANESAAIDELRRHNEIIRDLLNAHHGREIKTIGDAFLAEFPLADDALRCAVGIHQALEQAFTEADPLRVRIGLHVAEVEAIGPDVIGDGVNILSRIEPLAQPNGICASRDFLDALGGREVRFVSLGPVQMKNIAHPVELFAWPAAPGEKNPSGRSRTSNSLPLLAAAAAEELTALDRDFRPAQPPGEADATLALSGPLFPPGDAAPTAVISDLPASASESLPAPAFTKARNARPLSKSSGIFAASNVEPFVPPPQSVREEPTAFDRPASRNLQPAFDLPDLPEESTSAGRFAATANSDSYPKDVTRSEIGFRTGAWRGAKASTLESKDIRLIVGAVVGAVVLLSLLAVAWILTRSKPATPMVPLVAPAPAAKPPQAPRPASTPAPAPLAAAPARAVAAPAPVAKPRAKRTHHRLSLAAQVRTARSQIRASHLSRHHKRLLRRELDEIYHRYLHARGRRAKREEESALQRFMKKHHLS